MDSWVEPPVKPYLKRNMYRERLHGYNTICSTIRDVFLLSTDEQVKLKCRVAMRMAKSMYNKMKENKLKIAELEKELNGFKCSNPSP
jgi:hypothetical protein